MMRLIFPKHVCELIQSGQRMMAESMEAACVVVLEVHDFVRLCSAVPMPIVVEHINRLFCAYDRLLEQNHVERLDIMGSTYIAYRALECVSLHASASVFEIK